MRFAICVWSIAGSFFATMFWSFLGGFANKLVTGTVHQACASLRSIIKTQSTAQRLDNAAI
jgi:hypothetical protein